MLKVSTQSSTPTMALWNDLVAAMLATGKFQPDRLQSDLLRAQHRLGRSVILMPNEEVIAAHVTRLTTNDPLWQEIAMAFVDEAHTKNGYLGQIVRMLLEKAPPDLRFFGITKDPAVMKVFRYKGLVPVTKVIEPQIELWAEAIGLGDRLPATACLDSFPLSEQIIAQAQDEKHAQRWLWKQTDCS